MDFSVPLVIWPTPSLGKSSAPKISGAEKGVGFAALANLCCLVRAGTLSREVTQGVSNRFFRDTRLSDFCFKTVL